MTAVVAVYVAGVALALWRTDASLPVRVALALFWPIGPLAFAVTVSILLAASLIGFPVFGAVVLLGAGLAWWMLS